MKFAHGYNIFVEIHYNVHNANKEYSSAGPKIPLLYKMRKFRIQGLHVMSWFALVSLPDLCFTYTSNTCNKSGDDCDELADWMTVCQHF